MAKRNRRILKTKAKSRRKSSSRRRGSVIEYAADPYVAEAIAKVVTGAISAGQVASSETTGPKKYTGHFRGTRMGFKRTKRKSFGKMRPAVSPTTIKRSTGLVIGRPKKLSVTQKFAKMANPPVQFNSKWAFQMDCDSARVSAIEIPILTQPLLAPIQAQLFTNMVSDTTAPDPTMVAQANTASAQYSLMIENYKSKISCYNSSTNTLRARVVWYKPARDLDGEYKNLGPNTNSPINQLMIASTQAQPILTTTGLAVGEGLVFDSLTPGSNFQANYAHGGQQVTGVSTTGPMSGNVVALLDPSLVPGSPQVRSQFRNCWQTLKTEEFVLEPGGQFNTSLTLKNRVVSSMFDDTDYTYKKKCTVFGVVYVLGQMVFNDVANNVTVSTGSSQLSFLREDTCTARALITKRTVRVNLTNPYVIISDADQGIINVQTNTEDTSYFEEN